MERKIVAYNDGFTKFYKSQDRKVRDKIKHVFDLVRFERIVPVKYFKRLVNSDGIYEIRVITTFKNIRILCFFDKVNLIVLTNFFIKKTQKTPLKEIRIAEKMKKEYLNEKYGQKNR